MSSEIKENIYRVITGTPSAVEVEMDKLAHEGYTFVAMTLCELPESPGVEAQAGICVIMTNTNAAIAMASQMGSKFMESMKANFDGL